MHELARVTLENEMDLILAHRRSMKLAELAGLSLAAQTTFATAVSEVSRNTIEKAKKGCLVLSVENELRSNYIIAAFKNELVNESAINQGLEYAKRLVDNYKVSTKGAETSIELFYNISPAFRIDLSRIDEWRSIFRNEPPVSPYDELKRKNEQLQALSETIQKSEAEYKILTNSLPLFIFSMNDNGHLIYVNEWLSKYSGETAESLNRNKWKNLVHAEDYDSFSMLFQNDIAKGFTTFKTQLRLRAKSNGEYLWHQLSLSPFKNEKGDLQYWIGYIVDIHTQKIVEETLKDNAELKETQEKLKHNQQTLENYIDELNRSNHELQQFAFVASHDLQEPVRKLLYYSDYLISRYAGMLDQKALDQLKGMQTASFRMRNLIHDLLLFSQINKVRASFSQVDLNKIASETLQDMERMIDEKKAVFKVDQLPVLDGDEHMMRQLFQNIISNAIKYAKESEVPVIQISSKFEDGIYQIAFEDNGIGFDEQYLPQMFALFQRLHARDEYEGTGLGLAICRKIVDLHSGKLWATGKEGTGATFFVSLPEKQPFN